MIVDQWPEKELGVAEGSRLRFAEGPMQQYRDWAGRRLLALDEEPAFELSFWCGTCQFLFQRLGGANESLSIPELRETLTRGFGQIDAGVVEAFSKLLPKGRYVPMLLRVEPRLIWPMESGDYFADEQIATWGVNPFWGLPENPQAAYYRTFETPVDFPTRGGWDAHLYEFVVPMLAVYYNDPKRVAEFEQMPEGETLPTAVALSTLDVCLPAMDHGSDWYEHWGLTHFLLDGHHKLYAAARSNRAVQILSLLSVDGSLADVDQIVALPGQRRREPAERPRPEGWDPVAFRHGEA